MRRKRLALTLLTAPRRSAGDEPQPVLAAFSTGTSRRLIRPERLGDFLRAHDRTDLVCSGAAPLYWALAYHFIGSHDSESVRCLRGLIRANRLLDVRLLGQLITLAETGVEGPAPPLADPAAATGSETLPDAGPLPKQVEALRGRPWEEVKNGLGDEAVRLAAATLTAYDGLRGRADQILKEFEIDHEVVDRFGPLSLGLQVRAAIALHRAGRRGLRCDGLAALAQRCEEVMWESAQRLHDDCDARKCFSWEADGPRVRLDPSGRPRDYPKKLERWAAATLDAAPGAHDISLRPPETALGRTVASSRLWGELVRCHELLRAWSRLEAAANVKRCAVASREAGGVLHPAYEVVPRVRSRNPDLDQLRAIAPAAAFGDAGGHGLLVIVMPDLDLRCLAEYCERRGLRSRLAELFRGGVDPVDFALAALLGGELDGQAGRDRVEALRCDNPSEYRWQRQYVRSLLDAASRGWGPAQARAVVRQECAHEILGVEIDEGFECLIRVIFPELRALYEDLTFDALHEQLGCDPRDTWTLQGGDKWRGQDPYNLREAIAGREHRPKVFARLREVCRNPEWRERLESGVGSRALYDELFRRTVVGPTGRVRGRQYFNQAEASAVLDYADDVRKHVLFALVDAGGLEPVALSRADFD